MAFANLPTAVAVCGGRRRVHGRFGGRRSLPLALSPLAVLLVMGLLASSAGAAEVPLGTTQSFAVLAGSTVTNTGPSLISGDLGVSPGSAVTGFPPGILTAGTMHAADAVALQAQSDLTIAYDNAFGRTGGAAISAPLGGGQTLVAGVYTSAADIAVGGDLTLDGGGDPDSVFVFQAKTGTLITAAGTTSGIPNTRVLLRNGAQACNVFWQVGSSATIQTATQFVGNILALTAISMKTGATLHGRALARNAAVTLDTNRITRAECSTQAPTPPSVMDTSATTAVGQPVTVDLVANDTTGAPLTYAVGSGPSHGSLAPIDQAAGTVEYTPDAGYAGSDSFTYQVTSSNGTSGTATADIVITPAAANTTTTPGTGPGAGGTTTPGSGPGAGGTSTTPGTGPGAGGTTATPGTESDEASDDTTQTPGSTTGTGGDGTTTGTSTGSPDLPFTGMTILWVLIAAALMVLGGAALRRYVTTR